MCLCDKCKFSLNVMLMANKLMPSQIYHHGLHLKRLIVIIASILAVGEVVTCFSLGCILGLEHFANLIKHLV